MPQFLLYENQSEASRDFYPYFVNVQCNLLETLNTRVVTPLTPLRYLDYMSISTLCLITVVDDVTYALLTQQITTVPITALKVSVASLDDLCDEIIAAIDMLITGIRILISLPGYAVPTRPTA